MSVPVRLSLADQVLIWSCLAMVGPARDAADVETFGKIVADVLPKATRANAYIDRIVIAASAVINAGGPTDEMELIVRLREFARWRAGLSLDAWREHGDGGA